MNTRTRLLLIWVLANLSALPALAAPSSLIVVEDRGGVSALPYYQKLNPQPQTLREVPELPRVASPATTGPSGNTGRLPVHSALLTPGEVPRRVIQASALSPIFLIGDDERSRAWLSQRLDTLRQLGAIGLVVNIESPAGLDALRRLAPGLTLVPTPGDDLAQRLRLRHYPVLITATGIEQ